MLVRALHGRLLPRNKIEQNDMWSRSAKLCVVLHVFRAVGKEAEGKTTVAEMFPYLPSFLCEVLLPFLDEHKPGKFSGIITTSHRCSN